MDLHGDLSGCENPHFRRAQMETWWSVGVTTTVVNWEMALEARAALEKSRAPVAQGLDAENPQIVEKFEGMINR